MNTERESLKAVRTMMETLRRELDEIETRKGWQALGYTSFEAFVAGELGISLMFLRRVLAGDPLALTQWIQRH